LPGRKKENTKAEDQKLIGNLGHQIKNRNLKTELKSCQIFNLIHPFCRLSEGQSRRRDHKRKGKYLEPWK
jgi:hypothetical protein